MSGSDKRAPEDCTSMEELRAEIDRVDDALFDLFAERMTYIHRAAELKAGIGLPANIPTRVDQVVENARRRAAAHGLAPELYGSIWEKIVEAAIAEEERRLNGKAEQ
ncbi:chorismate mutase [Consotaella aegiceratis]|uniref:chorismate mutase n=1 Tax=Consotaella aegiceratis TaxID=3097961 RepID=UPI002F408C56